MENTKRAITVTLVCLLAVPVLVYGQGGYTASIRGVVTDRGRYQAPHVVLATGADATEHGKLLGIEIPVHPDSHEAGITALVIAGGAASGFLIAPWFADLFLKGKYVLGPTLIGAAVFANENVNMES